MLVLSRKPGEQIRIGDNVTITLVEVRGNRIKIGIDAPRDVNVVRSELQPHHEPQRRAGGRSARRAPAERAAFNLIADEPLELVVCGH